MQEKKNLVEKLREKETELEQLKAQSTQEKAEEAGEKTAAAAPKEGDSAKVGDPLLISCKASLKLLLLLCIYLFFVFFIR